MPMKRHIRSFSEIGIDDVPIVGGKNASLGEMYRNLSLQGVTAPNGFAITAEAYRYVLEKANAWRPLPEGHKAQILDAYPDTIVKTTVHVLEIERQLGRVPHPDAFLIAFRGSSPGRESAGGLAAAMQP